MGVLELLQGSLQLGALPPDALEALAGAFVVSSRPEKSVLFSEGDHGDALYLVVSGEVAVTRKERKRVHVLNRLGPGGLFGLASTLLETHRSNTATTLVPTQIAALHKTPAMLLFNQSAPIAYAFQKVVAHQLARDLRDGDRRLRELVAQLPGDAPPR